MSNQPPAASAESRRPDRRLHRVGALLAATAAVAALFAVNTASVGATDSATDTADGTHRSALGDVADQAIDTFVYHAPEVSDSTWCSAMEEHHGDWNGFADEVRAAADDWSSTEDQMFEFVGVVTQSVCPDVAAVFLDSTD